MRSGAERRSNCARDGACGCSRWHVLHAHDLGPTQSERQTGTWTYRVRNIAVYVYRYPRCLVTTHDERSPAQAASRSRPPSGAHIKPTERTHARVCGANRIEIEREWDVFPSWHQIEYTLRLLDRDKIKIKTYGHMTDKHARTMNLNDVYV